MSPLFFYALGGFTLCKDVVSAIVYAILVGNCSVVSCSPAELDLINTEIRQIPACNSLKLAAVYDTPNNWGEICNNKVLSFGLVKHYNLYTLFLKHIDAYLLALQKEVYFLSQLNLDSSLHVWMYKEYFENVPANYGLFYDSNLDRISWNGLGRLNSPLLSGASVYFWG